MVLKCVPERHNEVCDGDADGLYRDDDGFVGEVVLQGIGVGTVLTGFEQVQATRGFVFFHQVANGRYEPLVRWRRVSLVYPSNG